VKKSKDSNIKFLTQNEMMRLVPVIKNRRDRVIFSVAYHHGLRISEIGLLQRAGVDFNRGGSTSTDLWRLNNLVWADPSEHERVSAP
jgi:integrase